MTSFISSKIQPPIYHSVVRITPEKEYKLQSTCHSIHQEIRANRRHMLASGGISVVSVLSLNSIFPPLVAWAIDEPNEQEEKDESLVGAFKSLFDPNEKTKTGKVLPKAYLSSAREVVKTLRESLKEDPKDMAKFRRTADAAKESIREFFGSWRGQQAVVSEESYIVLEKAIRTLAGFYSKAGPSAPLPEQVKSDIINNLDTADKSNFWSVEKLKVQVSAGAIGPGCLSLMVGASLLWLLVAILRCL
ncbi:photosystem II D1 precursor processing protein PSB27-H2, chloroplastic [Tanacetum coccineum]